MILDRRRFLAALGLGASSAFLPWGRSLAGPAAPPKRLVMISTNHGAWYDGWAMRPGGAGGEDQRWEVPLGGLGSEEFSRSLRPLHAFRDSVTVLDGLCLTTAELDRSSFRHDKGRIHMWTGREAVDVGGAILSGGPSIDQAVAQAIARPDRLPSLVLSVGRKEKAISHAGARHPLPYEGDPRRVYERLFGLADGSGDPSEDPALQASVLDFAELEYEALLPRLGGAERERLEQHWDLVRDLEIRLGGMAAAECEAPPVPDALPEASGAAYTAAWDGHVQLIAAAFACDLTRVVSVTFDDIPGDLLGVPGVAVHEDHAHWVWSVPDSAELMTDYQALHASQIAGLLAALAAIPEGNGSVLDNTLVVWGNEMGDGAHGFDRVPVVLAGGAQAWQTGRYLHLPREVEVPLWGPQGTLPYTGIPHQHLLVDVARAFGLEGDTFGAEELATAGGTRRLQGGVPLLT